MTKRFVYNISGFVEIEAETQEEADSKVWELTLLESNVDLNIDSVEEL